MAFLLLVSFYFIWAWGVLGRIPYFQANLKYGGFRLDSKNVG